MIEDVDFKRLEEHFDLIYKRRNECNTDMEAIKKGQTDTYIKIAALETSQKFNNWLTAAVAGGIIALVIKIFLGGGA